MEHLIKLLPDHIANQIAAGEVVQRPASVVKELLENSIDAGADRIDLVIKDAGKALVQVIDNGSGLSIHDARMAFERHATSKISNAADLFNIRTMGFRGEALASIAAVAQVSMKTRLHTEELGTELIIEGSEIKRQEPVMTPSGTCISVKNLFFNVPARRNFLKTNPVETRHILNEFIRVAMANPKVGLRFEHNGQEIYDLRPGDARERVIDLFGRNLKGKLIQIEEETPYLKMFGFVGRPELAKKTRGDQFFFVNQRFIKSHYLNHAVRNAFGDLLPADKHPFYCIFLGIDPQHVDINIHPTKTEIKFDDERTVYSLLMSVIKKGLAEIHDTPEIDFGKHEEKVVEAIRQTTTRTPSHLPENLKFPNTSSKSRETSGTGWDELSKAFPSDWGTQKSKSDQKPPEKKSAQGWERLFFQEDLKPEGPVGSGLMRGTGVSKEEAAKQLFDAAETQGPKLMVQFRNRFILTENRAGLLVIDQHYAHQRILYEKFLTAEKVSNVASQQLLFPKSLTFSPMDFSVMREIEPQIHRLGFDLKEFGKDTFILHGIPAGLDAKHVESIFEEVITELRERGQVKVKEKMQERLARSIAIHSAMPSGKKLNPAEIRRLVDDLMACEHPGISPTGKPTYYTLSGDELDRFFG